MFFRAWHNWGGSSEAGAACCQKSSSRKVRTAQSGGTGLIETFNPLVPQYCLVWILLCLFHKQRGKVRVQSGVTGHKFHFSLNSQYCTVWMLGPYDTERRNVWGNTWILAMVKSIYTSLIMMRKCWILLCHFFMAIAWQDCVSVSLSGIDSLWGDGST